jgi:hypothetical protein
VDRSSIWRRARRLDWWIDPSDAERYRKRKDGGTRVPLNEGDFGQYGRGYLAIFVAAVCSSAGAMSLLGRTSPWAKAAGVLLLALIVGAVVLIIRYVRLPVDEEFTKPAHSREP